MLDKNLYLIRISASFAVIQTERCEGLKNQCYAGIAQLVEHDLAKVGVAGSNPVSRSKKSLLSEAFC